MLNIVPGSGESYFLGARRTVGRSPASAQWRLTPLSFQSDPGAGDYGLLDPHLAEEPALPPGGLLSTPYLRAGPADGLSLHGIPGPMRTTATPQPTTVTPSPGLMELYGFGIPPSTVSPATAITRQVSVDEGHQPPSATVVTDSPASTDPSSNGFFGFLNDAMRFAAGLEPQRDDLRSDEDGNILAPETKQLIDDIATATKADELALRRRIIAMFPGEPRTANWFHSHLSDVLDGDPPEDVHSALSYFADERARDNRNFSTFLTGAATATLPAHAPAPSRALADQAIVAPSGARPASNGPWRQDVLTNPPPAVNDPTALAREHYDGTKQFVREQREGLQAIGPEALQRGGIGLNRQQGLAMEPWALAFERETSGYVVDPGGRLNLPYGIRTYDATYRQVEGAHPVGYAEFKSGDARRTSQQRLNDEHMEDQGFFIRLITEQYLRERSR